MLSTISTRLAQHSTTNIFDFFSKVPAKCDPSCKIIFLIFLLKNYFFRNKCLAQLAQSEHNTAQQKFLIFFEKCPLSVTLLAKLFS